MNQMIKDLPIYINGFVVTYLFVGTKCDFIDFIMFGLAMISFLWYGHKKQEKKVN